MFKFPYMIQALQEAKLAIEEDEVPVGAVLVVDGDLVVRSHNLSVQSGVPHHHAEMLAIEKAVQEYGDIRHVNTELYVTLEPCPMCAQAIAFARINTLYYGAADTKGGGVENGPRIFKSSSCHHQPEIYSGIMENECAELLREFFVGKRG
jgi:tRNA(adenine34) deaminase